MAHPTFEQSIGESVLASTPASTGVLVPQPIAIAVTKSATKELRTIMGQA